jgi:hypothetical protein
MSNKRRPASKDKTAPAVKPQPDTDHMIVVLLKQACWANLDRSLDCQDLLTFLCNPSTPGVILSYPVPNPELPPDWRKRVAAYLRQHPVE